MSFATSTMKVRSISGPKNELEGLLREHTVKLNDSGSLAVARSAPLIALENARNIKTVVVAPADITVLAATPTRELAHLRPVHILFNSELFGLGMAMNDGKCVMAGDYC